MSETKKTAAFWGGSVHVPGYGTEPEALAYAAEQADLVEPDAEPVGVETEQTEGGENLSVADGPEAGHGEAAHSDSYADDHAGEHHFPDWVLVSPALAMTVGLIAAFAFYRRGDPLRPGLLREGGLLYGFLRNRWYIDGLYRRLFLEPARILGRFFWKGGDERVIDGFGPDGLSRLAGTGARAVTRGQTGYVFHYAFVMLIGVTVLLLMILL